MGDLSTWAQLAPQIVVALVIVGSTATLLKLLLPKDAVTRGEFDDLKTEIGQMDGTLTEVKDTVTRIDIRQQEREKREKVAATTAQPA